MFSTVKKSLSRRTGSLARYSHLDGLDRGSYADVEGSDPQLFANVEGSDPRLFADAERSDPRLIADAEGSARGSYADVEESNRRSYVDVKASKHRSHADAKVRADRRSSVNVQGSNHQSFANVQGSNHGSFGNVQGSKHRSFANVQGSNHRSFANVQGSKHRSFANVQGSNHRSFANVQGSKHRSFANVQGSNHRSYADVEGSHADMEGSYHRSHADMEGSYHRSRADVDASHNRLQLPVPSPMHIAPQLQPSLLLPRLDADEKDFFDLVIRGDVSGVVEFLQDVPDFNINCEDFSGCTALVLAVLADNEDMVQLLLRYDSITLGDSVLQAAKIGNCHIVEMLLKFQSDFGDAEAEVTSADFTADITPIILAALHGHYELIKLLMDHGYSIDKPHSPSCFCEEKCAHKKKGETLSQSIARINMYKALTNPAYISQSSADPILTAFQLSQEMIQYSNIDREFKMDYLELSEQCKQYAVDLLHQCRTTEEVETILTRKEGHLRKGFKPVNFTRLNLAVDLEQKAFVAHSNCQQVLRAAWLADWQDWKSLSIVAKFSRIIPRIVFLPFMVLIYLLSQTCLRIDFVQEWRSPINKFLLSTASYIIFLIILFIQNQMDSDAFHRGPPKTGLETLIVIYVIGLMWAEFKQVWFLGWKKYSKHKWNWYDILMFIAFISSFIAWFVAYEDVRLYGNENLDRRFWKSNDPSLVAEGLFAIATVFAFARILYIFQIGNTLGPVQVSVSRMFGDIIEFLAIFLVILFSFACGLNCLYHYYKNEFRDIDGYIKTQHYGFSSFQATCKSLFWSLFGVVPMEAADVVINEYKKEIGNETVTVQNKHKVTEGIGFFLYGFYEVVTMIILLNLLIAMMSNTYTKIEENADAEWKFARTTVWLSYFEEGSTMPPPFNLIPSPKMLTKAVHWFNACCCKNDPTAKCTALRCCHFEKESEDEDSESYQALMSALVQRYIRQKAKDSETQTVTISQLNELRNELKDLKQLTQKLSDYVHIHSLKI